LSRKDVVILQAPDPTVLLGVFGKLKRADPEERGLKMVKPLYLRSIQGVDIGQDKVD